MYLLFIQLFCQVSQKMQKSKTSVATNNNNGNINQNPIVKINYWIQACKAKIWL